MYLCIYEIMDGDAGFLDVRDVGIFYQPVQLTYIPYWALFMSVFHILRGTCACLLRSGVTVGRGATI